MNFYEMNFPPGSIVWLEQDILVRNRKTEQIIEILHAGQEVKILELDANTGKVKAHVFPYIPGRRILNTHASKLTWVNPVPEV